MSECTREECIELRARAAKLATWRNRGSAQVKKLKAHRDVATEQRDIFAAHLIKRYTFKTSGPMQGDYAHCIHCGRKWSYNGEGENHAPECPIPLAKLVKGGEI